MSRSCRASARLEREFIREKHFDAYLIGISGGYFQELVVSGHEPSCR
jgi:hypothetical protein